MIGSERRGKEHKTMDPVPPGEVLRNTIVADETPMIDNCDDNSRDTTRVNRNAMEMEAMPAVTQTQEKRTWAQMLANKKGSGSTQLAFRAPTISEGKPIVQLQSTDFAEEQRECEELIVGNFVGKRLAFGYVKEVLTRTWKLKGKFEMKTHSHNTFIFKFHEEEDRKKVLDMGSMHIASRMFVIRPWRPFLEDDVDALNTVPIWVCLKGIPLMFWNPKGIEAIASAIGVPLRLDKATEDKMRMNYAKVCVEMNVNNTFPAQIPVVVDGNRSYTVGVEYTWRPNSCKHCNVFGHSTNGCTKTPNKPVMKVYKAVHKETTLNQVDVEEGWELPKKQHTTRNRSTKPIQQHAHRDTTIPEGANANDAPENGEKTLDPGEGGWRNMNESCEITIRVNEHSRQTDTAITDTGMETIKANDPSTKNKVGPQKGIADGHGDSGQQGTPNGHVGNSRWSCRSKEQQSLVAEEGELDVIDTSKEQQSLVAVVKKQQLQEFRDDCRDAGYSPNGIEMAIQAADSDAEVEPGLSSPISNSKESPMQVVEVLRAIAGPEEDLTTLMDCLTPQDVKAVHSAIARIGRDALINEVKNSLAENEAKVGQHTSEEEREVTIQPPTTFVPRMSSRSKKSNPKFR